MTPRKSDGTLPRPAIRVATAATIAMAIGYTVLVAVMLALVTSRLIHETDGRLAGEVATAARQSSSPPAISTEIGHDSDDAPVYLWRVSAAGTLLASTAGAPALPPELLSATQDFPRTSFVGGRDFRFDEASASGGVRVIAAESLTQEHHVRALLLRAALWASPLLLAGVFISAFIIGRQASRPVERARVRQLEFTADASHELRTPLTVIEAEVGLALASDRSVTGYRDALRRVSGETGRLRAIVEDLLWLARFDSHPPAPAAEIVDLITIARQCVDRFEPVMRSRGVRLDLEADPEQVAPISAAPEWIDRLLGVLMDNAIRYAGSPGRVLLQVHNAGGHVTLTVADNGPGIPVTERAKLFDRFHRADDDTSQGAGLGLAIADAVVASTHGRWTIGDAELGGASIAVSWRAPRAHTLARLIPTSR